MCQYIPEGVTTLGRLANRVHGSKGNSPLFRVNLTSGEVVKTRTDGIGVGNAIMLRFPAVN